MALFLLDTDILIDFLNGFEPTARTLRNFHDAGDALGITAIQIAEVFSGVEPDDRDTVASILRTFTCLELTPTIARKAGEYRHDFRRQGRILSTTDTLVAATAFQRAATLVTRNQRHYPMDDITIIVL
ncbi:MAG: type II toxin-antitoxin system VapC family toxin [Chloroflexi bacterium]|nr:type II toxin-antitoxin system VapC family toxin [Chloroflexota bacterium]